jgi:hypothetical protein
MRDGGARGEHGRAHVDVQQRVDVGKVQVGDRRITGDAGIVDQDVEPAQLFGPPPRPSAVTAAASALSAWMAKPRRPSASIARTTSAARSADFS